MLHAFGTESFRSVWYWLLTIVVWTHVCGRTLGVPHDMVLRARRLPEVAGRVEFLAGIAAERLAALNDAVGLPVAAFAGFALACLAAIGFGVGVELAQAAFALALPLALVALATLRLALGLRRDGICGAELQRALSRRRLWNQVIATVAMLAAAVLAVAQHPAMLRR